MTQSFIHIESPNYLKAETLASPADWAAVFGNDRPLALEIGCGIGDFMVKTAAEKPATNFIAIDFYNKGCYKTCRRLDRHGVTNVRVLRDLGRAVLETERWRGRMADCGDGAAADSGKGWNFVAWDISSRSAPYGVIYAGSSAIGFN